MFGRVLLPCREEWIWWHFNGIQLSIQSLRCFLWVYKCVLAMSIFQHVGLHVWRFQLPSGSFEGDSNRWDLGVSGWEASVRSLSLIIMGDTWRMNVMWHHSKFDGSIVSLRIWGFLCNMFPSNWKLIKSCNFLSFCWYQVGQIMMLEIPWRSEVPVRV